MTPNPRDLNGRVVRLKRPITHVKIIEQEPRGSFLVVSDGLEGWVSPERLELD
jgi:hypothetical protein